MLQNQLDNLRSLSDVAGDYERWSKGCWGEDHVPLRACHREIEAVIGCHFNFVVWSGDWVRLSYKQLNEL